MEGRIGLAEENGLQPRSRNRFLTYIRKHWFFYMLALPGFLYIFVFRYMPMYGILIAFKDFKVSKGIWRSPWVGLENFTTLFKNEGFYRVLANTVIINIYNIVFGFIFIIFLSLLLNEIVSTKVKRTVQTIIYLPNFVSWVVFAGLITIFLNPEDGAINKVIVALGGESVYFLIQPAYFRAVLVISNILKSAGFATIIYLASLAGIDPGLYESAIIDGANRLQKIRYITLPRLYPTIAVLLMLEVANIFGSNFEQVFNLYNPLVYDTGDVISTYLYRVGFGGELPDRAFEISTALSTIFNVISLTAMYIANRFVKKMDVIGIF